MHSIFGAQIQVRNLQGNLSQAEIKFGPSYFLMFYWFKLNLYLQIFIYIMKKNLIEKKTFSKISRIVTNLLLKIEEF